MITRLIDRIVIAGRGAANPHGVMRFGGLTVPCRLGRSGISRCKREGDGATPAGRFPVRHGFYRADRLTRPRTALPMTALVEDDGWCDDPGRPEYNRFVRHPFAGSAERLWRDDRLYDIIVVIGHNDSPPVRGAGSAVFLHLAPEAAQPTQGCVAVDRTIMLNLLSRLSPQAVLDIG